MDCVPPAGQRSLEEILDLARSNQQEFNLLTKREQSRLDSRCPSLFTLEYERLGGLLPFGDGRMARCADRQAGARHGLRSGVSIRRVCTW